MVYVKNDYRDVKALCQHFAILLPRVYANEMPLEYQEFEMKKQSSDSKSSSDLVRVRVLTADDAEAYRAVRLLALGEQPPAFGSRPEDEPNLLETALRLTPNDDRCFFGAFEIDRLIGIVRLSRYEAANEKHRAYLAGLYVLPAFRRIGCGRSLVSKALNWAIDLPGIRRINLTVVTHQTAAIHLYRSMGFQIYGTEQETFSRAGRFYDEHLMTLNLTSGQQQKIVDDGTSTL